MGLRTVPVATALGASQKIRPGTQSLAHRNIPARTASREIAIKNRIASIGKKRDYSEIAFLFLCSQEA